VIFAARSPPAAAGYVHVPGRLKLASSFTPRGRAQLQEWVQTPVEHLRDLRAELLLKLTLAERCGIEVSDMLESQRHRIEAQAETLAGVAFDGDGSVRDVVALWRYEASQAGLRFLLQLAANGPG
jgi:hypothetical protein